MQVVTIHIETPKGSFVKRDEHGSEDFVSPLPAPFNYGHVVGQMGGDGDPLDAVLLGSALQSGESQGYVVGVVRFVDCNQPDDKWICSPQPCISKNPTTYGTILLGYMQWQNSSGPGCAFGVANAGCCA